MAKETELRLVSYLPLIEKWATGLGKHLGGDFTGQWLVGELVEVMVP